MENPSLISMKIKYIKQFLFRRKYELLLIALFLHLFIAVVLTDLAFYAQVIWPINMLILGIFSVGIFKTSKMYEKVIKNILGFLVVALPATVVFLKPTNFIMQIINLTHVAFYIILFTAVLRYLLRPSYISIDIVSASVCGYLILIEIGIFTMQFICYATSHPFKGVDLTSFTTIYLDLVYFCSITVTSIGFGDITPANHYTKLATSILGIAGQFYSVVLIGMMISKYTSAEAKEK